MVRAGNLAWLIFMLAINTITSCEVIFSTE